MRRPRPNKAEKKLLSAFKSVWKRHPHPAKRMNPDQLKSAHYDPAYISGRKRVGGSKCEDQLAEILLNLGHAGKFTRQKPISHFFADFCFENKRLVIEVDGPPHGLKCFRRAEEYRNGVLRRAGYKIFRIPCDMMRPERREELIQMVKSRIGDV